MSLSKIEKISQQNQAFRDILTESLQDAVFEMLDKMEVDCNRDKNKNNRVND